MPHPKIGNIMKVIRNSLVILNVCHSFGDETAILLGAKVSLKNFINEFLSVSLERMFAL